jgi:hypothetical protein
MTAIHSRAQVLATYRTVHPDGHHPTITSPGKFEDEPIWIPYFYDLFLSGDGDTYDDSCGHMVAEFNVCAADVTEFPELAPIARVRFWESQDGFVYSESLEE